MSLLKRLFKRDSILAGLGIQDNLKATSLYKDAWKRLKKNKLAMASLFVISFLILVAIFAPLISPYDPDVQDLVHKLSPPNGQHVMGTDNFGRDILARIIYGSRVSLSVGLIAESIAVVIGVLLGAMAGYFGGVVDAIISRIIEIFASFPFILFAIAIMFAIGPGIFNVYLAIGIIGWTGLARLIRGQVIQLKQKEYIEAAIANGAGSFRIIFKHLIPNCLSLIIVVITLNIPADIILEASLSFLGLGVQPPMSSWGAMIKASQMYMRVMPSFAIFPGIAIMITVLAFNMLGDGLRDALDPKLKNS
jgi:peptide/nickel transport system permease protein